MSQKYDLVINNGSVILPEKYSEPVTRHIGIRGEKIVEISEKPLTSSVQIDASGLIVSPGFIDFHSHINGREFSAECALRQGVTTTIGGERIFQSDVPRRIESEGFLINQGFYISYSFTLRKAVGLNSPVQQATKSEIEDMLQLTERFFQYGVLGIHFGLEYIPATTLEELEALLRLAKEYDILSMIHLRRDGNEALSALDEIIKVATTTGASINLVHTMYTAGLPNLLDEYLRRITTARDAGCNITADTGVYASFPTLIGAMTLEGDWEKKYRPGVSAGNLLVGSGIHVGQYCDEELFSYLRREYPATLIIAFLFDEAIIPTAIKPDYMMISTNSCYGPHSVGIGHPESTGTFPKLIRNYVLDEPVLTMKQAIEKCSTMPARLLGLDSKGEIKVGMDADLTIFDPKTIRPRSDFVDRGDPTAWPDGIRHVIINGSHVLNDGVIAPNKRNCGTLIRINRNY